MLAGVGAATVVNYIVYEATTGRQFSNVSAQQPYFVLSGTASRTAICVTFSVASSVSRHVQGCDDPVPRTW